ncbi:multi -bridging factor 1b-like [Olea europaea subsp. europaea]|uniref:Multi -bridging factor 1b-like n=1 Tax=Olea europaea subsp. europaea TaxID=158383 RepID=A0A8S0TRT1_OLEEU|nr:multi -bridging factor 1b-like [Olea europaea subsp. europaea]
MAGIAQDWEPVVIRKKAPTAAARKDEKAVNAARRSGAEIETVKKSNAGTNRAASSSTTLNTRKLDEETDNLAHEKVPSELKRAIMQARLDKKLTQAQLAQVSLLSISAAKNTHLCSWHTSRLMKQVTVCSYNLLSHNLTIFGLLGR